MTTHPRRFKDTIYEQFARIGNAVASPRRLELLDLLCQSPRTVEALANQAGQSLANTSHHLQILRAARLVNAEKQGQFVSYSLANAAVGGFYQVLRRLAESRLVEVEAVTRAFLEERGMLEAVDRHALLERVRQGEVTVLDVRPIEEYRAGHLPRALSIPLEELEQRIGEIPRDQEVVAYCRGSYCVLAVEAVTVLRTHGFRALRMEEGIPEWREHGFEIAGEEAAPSC